LIFVLKSDFNSSIAFAVLVSSDDRAWNWNSIVRGLSTTRSDKLSLWWFIIDKASNLVPLVSCLQSAEPLNTSRVDRQLWCDLKSWKRCQIKSNKLTALSQEWLVIMNAKYNLSRCVSSCLTNGVSLFCKGLLQSIFPCDCYKIL